MQVYRELRILTARPGPEDESKAPHLLYGVLSASQACSAGIWLSLAKPTIDEALAQDKLPVVTGGTGLYIKALIDGLSPIPDISENARKQAAAVWEQQGEQALKTHDPAMAAKLKPGDTQRHVRALEVWLSTGKSLLYWQSLPREPVYPDARFEIEIVDLPREELYRRCDMRFTAMLEAGALEEVRDLLAFSLPPDRPAMRAVGVPELAAFLIGECSLDEASAKARQATRNYAKRQLTWFRHQLQKHIN